MCARIMRLRASHQSSRRTRAPDRIVAEHETRLCGRETWLLDRLRNTAEYFSGACGDKTTATRLTLEDPPDQTKLKERLEDLKRRR